MSSQAFGKRLAQLRREKAARDELDIDHKTVASAVGASAASVSRWEAGEVMPGEDYLEALAAYYGVSRAWLRYGEGERSSGTGPARPINLPAELAKSIPKRGVKVADAPTHAPRRRAGGKGS